MCARARLFFGFVQIGSVCGILPIWPFCGLLSRSFVFCGYFIACSCFVRLSGFKMRFVFSYSFLFVIFSFFVLEFVLLHWESFSRLLSR